MSSGAHDLLPVPPPKMILVVDDNVLVRFAIADYLREFGFEVFEAGDGLEAVDLLKAETPIDLVFSDIQMPGWTVSPLPGGLARTSPKF